MKKFYLKNIYCELKTTNITMPLIVTFHGIFGSSLDLNIQRLKKAAVNFNFFSFDYSGHGKSSGGGVTISKILKDKDCVMDYLRSYNELILFGYSFGAYPAIMEASSNPKVIGLVLFSPVLDIFPLVFSKKSNRGLSKFTSRHKKTSLTSKLIFLVDAMRHNLNKASKNITCPVFLLQSSDDNIVPYTQAKKLSLKPKSFLIKGEDHRFSKTDIIEKKIMPELLKWFEEL